jgi:hypothetical protein
MLGAKVGVIVRGAEICTEGFGRIEVSLGSFYLAT